MDINGKWGKPKEYVASAGGSTHVFNAELYQGVNVKLRAGPSRNTQEIMTFQPNQFG